MMNVPRMGLRMAGVLVLAHALVGAGVSRAYFAGGGKDAAKGNDCLIGYNFVDPDQVTQDGKKNVVVCTDCDPSCDLDGVNTANGSCTIAVGVCINQSGVEGCTPPAALDKASAKGKVKGVKGDGGKIAVEVPQLLEGSACGAMLDVLIPLKTSKKGASDGKATLNLSASVKKNKSEGIAGRSDKDKLTYVCQPRPEGEACGNGTTTSTVTTTITTTTVESTSTTVASTTSTTTSTSTSSTTSSTTSTTVVSTSTTLVSTSTTVASTSSTSTTEVTTTSTTTTTVDLCGNNTIDPGEQCDGTDLGGATCVSSPSAAILCTAECTLDFSQCPGDTTTSTTTPSSSTSSTIASTTSTSAPASSTTSTTAASTTSTSTTTSTSLPTGTVLAFTTGEPTGQCGAVKSGGAGGTVRKALNCGGLNTGGGQSTVAEGPTPGGASTLINVAGSPPTLTLSGRTAAQTGSNRTCSDTACIFGPYLPISNAGTSSCVQNTFASPASGTLDVTTGVVDGSFPLTSTVYLTANGTAPCPKCVGGTPGVTNSGTCQAGWTSGVGASPTEGNPCTPTDTAGDTYDCDPPPAALLPSFPVNLTPITTGTASKSNAGGLFCPSQANSGAFGCAGSGAANGICPGGNVPPLIDYIEEIGSPAGFLSAGSHSVTLASTFCIPSVGGSLGFLINGAANLPGPGATSLPGTLELLP